MLLNSQLVKDTCLNRLLDKQHLLNEALLQLKEASANETKSTAGDKHEVAKALLQSEQEKLGQQFQLITQQIHALQKINGTLNATTVSAGSLIETTKGYFFIGAALGKLNISNYSITALSVAAPLAQKLIGLKVNDSCCLNEQIYNVTKIL